jgi:hypothetical protein
MPIIDPWDKAAECERFIQATNDPQRRAILTNLRERWVALANQVALGRPDWQDEAQRIDRLHADATRPRQP